MIERLVWCSLPIVASAGSVAFVIVTNRYIIPRVDNSRLERPIRGLAIIGGFLATLIVYTVVLRLTTYDG